ncbi:hypothetical protein GWI33_003490 [Rhynchophorus ferrugineus]|uniref:Uncharacterized protein n=1 Tax=Rhynchophorus ferrugineus TaxID=354439 RepID=A0A834HK45_RHYFE|nr:hypothetical protein GWI33_003490 [Rhynchophorus ferrugineus]
MILLKSLFSYFEAIFTRDNMEFTAAAGEIVLEPLMALYFFHRIDKSKDSKSIGVCGSFFLTKLGDIFRALVRSLQSSPGVIE